MKKLFLFSMFAFLVSIIGNDSYAGTLKITEFAVTTKISKGKPIDSVHRISHRSVKKLYGFTRTVSDSNTPVGITHIWSRDGHVQKQSKLSIKGKKWQVNSSLPMDASRKGNWRLEIRDESDSVLKSLEFRIH